MAGQYEAITFSSGSGLQLGAGRDAAKVVRTTDDCNGLPAGGTVEVTNLGPDDTVGTSQAYASFTFDHTDSDKEYTVCYRVYGGVYVPVGSKLVVQPGATAPPTGMVPLYRPSLHRTVGAGSYRMCYQPGPAALWERVVQNQLSIVALPSMHPVTAIAGMLTPLTFTGTIEWSSSTGDYVVLSAQGCAEAHEVVTNGTALTGTVLGAVATDTNQGHVLTSVDMVNASTLVVCYASKESGGHSPDDFAALPSSLVQVAPIAINPNRTISGARQIITVTGGVAGDSVAWTQAADCKGHKAGSAPATSTLTAEYNVTGSSTTPALHGSGDAASPSANSPTAGLYRTCYRPTPTGLWTHVTGIPVTVVAVPVFSPLAGVASTVTRITFTTPGATTDVAVKDGDLVFLTATDCVQGGHPSNSSVTGPSQLQRTATNGSVVSTVEAMGADNRLKVCYASAESTGDSQDDYLSLALDFRQGAPLYWRHSAYNNASVTKDRVPAGAAHRMLIEGTP